jgi:signal peptidase II
MKKHLWTTSFFIVFFDFLTKLLTVKFVPVMGVLDNEYPFGGLAVFENIFGIGFSINHVVNEGAAWGVFSGYGHLLFIFRCVVIIALFLYLLFADAAQKYFFPTLLIFSGAIGNVIDYLIYGHVIDMFHFTFGGYSFPIFNVADSCITIGAICYVMFSFFERSKTMVGRHT